jgi:hypothetical protein
VERQQDFDAVKTAIRVVYLPWAEESARHLQKVVAETTYPAIAVRESTGGKYACKSVSYSAFGWGSCKISFKSYDHAIEVMATNLGGNNPKTARYYDNKSVKDILETYNPPSVVPTYAKEVMAIMDKIENQ